MKATHIFRSLLFLSFFFLLTGGAQGQSEKKARIRLTATYVNVIDHEQYLNIKASARVDRENIEVSDPR